jgi:hypothetical protein
MGCFSVKGTVQQDGMAVSGVNQYGSLKGRGAEVSADFSHPSHVRGF